MTTDVFTTLTRLQSQSAQIDLNDTKVSDELRKFDTDLGKFERQLKTTSIDKTTIDQLYTWLEHSIESSDNLYCLLERLKLVDTLHKESPQLWDRIKKIR